MPKTIESDTKVAHLADRGVLQISGDDAATFLQGLVTNDVEKLHDGQAIFAGLLTPQGKILFDFFILRAGDSFLIDVATDKAAELAKRLGFYKLRAKVVIENKSDDMAVLALWGNRAIEAPPLPHCADPRLADLGLRLFAPAKALDYAVTDIANSAKALKVAMAEYHAHRLGLGIPEGGKDYDFGDCFAHEACMDQLAGIDFDKGCYVGQEVVSRMQHRGTARKRCIPLRAATAQKLPPAGSEIRAGKAVLGAMGSAQGQRAMALIRLDRAAKAIEKGEVIAAEGITIKLIQPEWASFEVPQEQL